MCGIAGYFSENHPDETAVSRMLNSISHRGPDESSEYHFDSYHVGMCRLSINDPATGSQPLFNTSRKVVVMYNGEIYNSPELRKTLESRGYSFRTSCDGEVICHLYDEYGDDLFGHLDGMFAIALWDESRRKLLLARDSAGEKPLYYAQFNGGRGLVFASELKALRCYSNISLTINRQALWDYPTFLWIPEPQTIFNEVNALGRGCIIKLDEHGFSLKAYRKHHHKVSEPLISDLQAVSETRRVVDEAVCSRLLSDVPIGSFLSGGLDSSIVSTVAMRELGSIHTFSVAFERLDDPYHGVSDESSEAAAYAQKLGTNHHTIRVTSDSFRDSLDRFCFNSDQPFGVSSGLGILAVAKAASDLGIKVLLSGDCADECFGGYSWYEHLKLDSQKSFNSFHEKIISFQNFGIPLNERLTTLSNYDANQRAWAWHYYAHEAEKKLLFSHDFQDGILTSLRHFNLYDSSSEWEPLQYIAQDREFYLPNEMLCKLDRMTMAYSVEGRVPFASPSVLELARRLDYSQMVKGSTLKWALRRAYAEILPDDVINRPKHGFNVPIDHWLKHEWHDLLFEAFSSESALHTHGIISGNALEVAEGMLNNSQRLNGHTLFCFITLNRWLAQLS